MNAEALRAESPVVQEAWDQTRRVNKVLERALLIASAVARGDSVLPEGAPHKDATDYEWMDFWLTLGAKHLVAA